MRIEVRETKITRAEIDPMDVVRAYPMEWEDYLGSERVWNDEDVLEFVKESFHEVGTEIFLDLPHVSTDHDTEMEVEIR